MVDMHMGTVDTERVDKGRVDMVVVVMDMGTVDMGMVEMKMSIVDIGTGQEEIEKTQEDTGMEEVGMKRVKVNIGIVWVEMMIQMTRADIVVKVEVG